jgi:hypothetical protein
MKVTIKKLLLMCVALLPSVGVGAQKSFYLDGVIHQNAPLAFKPHHGSRPFGSYLTMNVNYQPMAQLLTLFSTHYQHPLKSRGEAHITVITPVEYDKVLKKHITISEIDHIALAMNIQSSAFEVVCLGRGKARVSQKVEETFYVVLNSTDLLAIRQKIQDLYVKKGGDAKDFLVQHYYPHITLGFTSKDLHEGDGVIKNTQSCYAKLTSAPFH